MSQDQNTYEWMLLTTGDTYFLQVSTIYFQIIRIAVEIFLGISIKYPCYI